MPEETPPPNLNEGTFKAIDQIREVAKWLIVILGGIGGALIAGSQLSDIGSAEGWRLGVAIAGATLALGGVGAAIHYTLQVLTPKRANLKRLVDEGDKAPVAQLVSEEKGVLFGQADSIEGLLQKLEAKEAQQRSAQAALAKHPDDQDLKEAENQAESELTAVEDAREMFLGFARAEEVLEAMRRAVKVIVVGAALAAVGIGLFAWGTHPPKPSPDPAVVEAVPKDPSVVTVELSEHGSEALTKLLGDGCPTERVNAIALEGEPDALQLVSVPTARCEAARFTLTEDIGIVVSDEDLEPVPTCEARKPRPPCVYY